MGRPRVEINVIRGIRVKQLCEDQKISQQELSQTTGISQQNISLMINGKANVTESTAKILVREFPQYRFEWFMGYDDYKTIRDLTLSLFQQARHEANMLDEGFLFYATLNGYSIEYPDFSSSCHIEEAIENIKHGYTISKGDKSRRLSLDELRDFENDICDYIGFRLDRFMEKGR